VDKFRVTMATHELVENLVKYSGSAASSLHLAIREDTDGAAVTIRTINTATPERIAELRQAIDRISSASDPVRIYDEFIRESSSRAHGSGLGLARIRADGDLRLTLSVQESEVSIIVHGPVQLRR
jgi:hypothetical protein